MRTIRRSTIGTVAEAAARYGIAAATLARAEVGESVANRTKARIERALGIPYEELQRSTIEALTDE